MTCTKRRFPSEHAARQAHARASWRVKVYRCPDCGAHHVAAPEKAQATADRLVEIPSRLRRKGPRPFPGLAPERTLAEVQALAAQMRERHA